MLLTTESTAWAVAFSAGMTTGVILGHGVTPQALGVVAGIATLAVAVCAKLLSSLRDDVRA
jgi:hypothetical protein